MNNLKTVILLGAMTGIFMFVGGMAGGETGMLIAFIFAAIMNVGAYWFSDKIVLKTYRAVELPEKDFPHIYRMVSQLTTKAEIPMPKVYILNQDSPNAFATGRNPANSAIALSRGIIDLMSDKEIEGVIAHELTHIINRDTLISTVAATISGAIMFLAYQMRWFAILGGGRDDDDNGGIFGLILMAILAPLAATVIQMAISRSREYKADSGAANLTHNPEGLASGLQKLGQYSKRIPMKATKQTAHMFIVNPFSGKSLLKIFSTHPPIEERVARLRAMQF